MLLLRRCIAFISATFELEMRWFNPFLIASTLSAILASALDNYTVPPGSPGYQFGNSSQIIQFDEHSLFINGSRTFIFSGEFHPWRIPVPELWSDILQKMKVCILTRNCLSLNSCYCRRPGALMLSLFTFIGAWSRGNKEISISTIIARWNFSTKSLCAKEFLFLRGQGCVQLLTSHDLCSHAQE